MNDHPEPALHKQAQHDTSQPGLNRHDPGRSEGSQRRGSQRQSGQQGAEVIVAQGLCKSIQLGAGQRLELLREVDLTVASGESVAVMGRSGSGKSTLLALLGLLSTADSGVMRLAGQDVTSLRDRDRSRLRRVHIGFVFQNYSLLGHLTAAENVGLPLLHGNSDGGDNAGRVRAALEAVGIEQLARRRPAQLSGGEQQRTAIARALVCSPTIVLADEPTGALDTETADQVLTALTGSVASRGSALVLVTHDPEVAGRADRILRLEGGALT